MRLGCAYGAHTFADARTHKKPRCLGFSPSVNRALGGSLSHCPSISGQPPQRLCFSFSFFFRPRPFLLFVASQCETVRRCAWWLYLSVLPGAFAAGATPVCLSSSCHQSCGVKLKRSWRRRTDRQTDRQWAAAVSGLDGLRQPTGEPHADDALSPPCNAKGLIRVLSITFQAKLILTFKPGWSPCTLSRPSEYFVTGVGYKKQQYESTNKDKTDLQLKEHFVTFKRFFQLEIE